MRSLCLSFNNSMFLCVLSMFTLCSPTLSLPLLVPPCFCLCACLVPTISYAWLACSYGFLSDSFSFLSYHWFPFVFHCIHHNNRISPPPLVLDSWAGRNFHATYSEISVGLGLAGLFAAEHSLPALLHVRCIENCVCLPILIPFASHSSPPSNIIRF